MFNFFSIFFRVMRQNMTFQFRQGLILNFLLKNHLPFDKTTKKCFIFVVCK
jgi:hypothetical protein